MLFSSACRAYAVQSYYGAALCVCWSPDAAFVASGGEDDLVSTYSVAERQVCGHQKNQIVITGLTHRQCVGCKDGRLARCMHVRPLYGAYV